MLKKRRELLIYVLIIALQILVIVYWSNVKANYHVDELYSLGYASSYTGVGDGAQYITTSSDFAFDRWIKNTDLKHYLEVDDVERFTNASPGNVLKKIAVGSTYVFLLNVAETFWGDSIVSIKPSIILNCIFFVLASVLLISLMKKLDMDEKVRYFSIAMFGFSGYMISTVMYIRFYMLILLLMIAILNLFYRIWMADKWKQIILSQIGIGILIYLSYRNSEFALPFFGAFMGSFMLALLIKKKWKPLISCLAVCLAGVLFIATTSDFIGILLHPDKYNISNGVYVGAGVNIHNASVGAIKEYAFWLKKLFETLYFGNRTIVYCLMAAVTIVLILVSANIAPKDEKVRFDVCRIHPIIPWCFIVWVGILGVATILGQGRFICLVVLYLTLLAGIAQATGFKFALKKIRLSDDSIFIIVIALETLIYTLFVALCRYSIWRYYCYGFVSAIIVLWYAIDRLLKLECMDRFKKPIKVVLVLFVFVNSVLLFKTRNIENLYENEQEFIEKVKSNQDLDVVVISNVENGIVSRHEAYDCINMMSENTNICFVNLEDYGKSKVDYPERFILWTFNERDITLIINDLKRRGYEVEELGSDHHSKAYVCDVR